MKHIKKYCTRCNKKTYHEVYTYNEGYGVFGRIILAIGTAGVSEIIDTKHSTCCTCGKETKKDYI